MIKWILNWLNLSVFFLFETGFINHKSWILKCWSDFYSKDPFSNETTETVLQSGNQRSYSCSSRYHRRELVRLSTTTWLNTDLNWFRDDYSFNKYTSMICIEWRSKSYDNFGNVTTGTGAPRKFFNKKEILV